MKMWQAGLLEYNELEGIGWEWQSIDGCMAKAPSSRPPALESVGKNPTDRGKNGTKRSLLVDKTGIPLAIVISGTNTHDVKLLENTLDGTVVPRPASTDENPQNSSKQFTKTSGGMKQ